MIGDIRDGRAKYDHFLEDRKEKIRSDETSARKRRQVKAANFVSEKNGTGRNWKKKFFDLAALPVKLIII